MKKNHYLMRLPILLGTGAVLISLAGYNHDAYADTHCTPSQKYPAYTMTVPINTSITVGADTPNGTVIYRSNIIPDKYSGITCDQPISGVPVILDVSNPKTALTPWNTPPFGGSVYATSVPGIGVVGWRKQQGTPVQTDTLSNTQPGDTLLSTGFALSFIKIGDIAPGEVQLSLVPNMTLDIPSLPGYSGFPINLGKVSFTGTLHVVSQTCQTPDVNVDLGQRELRQYFKGIGSATPWVDSSITLQDCPRFYGTYDDNHYQESWDGEAPTGSPGENLLTVKITPNSDIIDATNGIMALESSDNDRSALGVGIQIGWGEAGNSPVPFNFMLPQQFDLPNSGVSSFRIPLAARYIQTEQAIAPGRGDAKATFLISYY